MKTIVLIGTEHKYQTLDVECRWKDAEAFQRFLLETCRKYGIKTLAEELSPEALKEAKKRWEKHKKGVEGSIKTGGI